MIKKSSIKLIKQITFIAKRQNHEHGLLYFVVVNKRFILAVSNFAVLQDYNRIRQTKHFKTNSVKLQAVWLVLHLRIFYDVLWRCLFTALHECQIFVDLFVEKRKGYVPKFTFRLNAECMKPEVEGNIVDKQPK